MGVERKVVADWLRKRWPGKVEWVEAGFGGSVGLSDALVTVRGERIELELKWGVVNTKGLRIEMRPAQRRHHFMLARSGGKSAILVGFRKEGELLFGVIPGRLVPMDLYDVGVKDLLLVETGEALRAILAGESVAFW